MARRLGTTRAFAWVAPRVLTRADLRLRRRKRTLSGLGTGLDVCYVTTTGRRSGEPRTVPLLYVPADGDGIVLAATNWGRKAHPAWSGNLDATPAATVAIGGQERPMRARRATEEELARYWPRLVELWPAYDAYRSRAGRDIRVYVLEPAPPAALDRV
jgi:deazaflavin-dependent oxidoreductase (nitroreductase family)